MFRDENTEIDVSEDEGNITETESSEPEMISPVIFLNALVSSGEISSICLQWRNWGVKLFLVLL